MPLLISLITFILAVWPVRTTTNLTQVTQRAQELLCRLRAQSAVSGFDSHTWRLEPPESSEADALEVQEVAASTWDPG